MDLSPRDLDLRLARAGWPRVLHQLLAGASHDLNGRVTAAGGVAQLLALEDDPSGVSPYLEEEVVRLRRAARLLAVLVEAGRVDEPAPLPLARMMPDVVEVHRHHRSSRNVERRLEVDPATPHVMGSAGLVLPLALVLLTKAATEAAAGDGVVEARLGRVGGDVGFGCRAFGSRGETDGRSETDPGGLEQLVHLAQAAGGELSHRRSEGATEFDLRLRAAPG